MLISSFVNINETFLTKWCVNPWNVYSHTTADCVLHVIRTNLSNFISYAVLYADLDVWLQFLPETYLMTSGAFTFQLRRFTSDGPTQSETGLKASDKNMSFLNICIYFITSSDINYLHRDLKNPEN